MFEDKARRIQEIANKLGWNSDIESLVERVIQMDTGLVQEDEFIYLLNWSGKCSLIHKLDQFFIPPVAKKKFSIPDLFVVFNNKGKESAYYIEIKTSKANKLSWTENYYHGLVNYSQKTGIPILIAWKWQAFGIWTLFELKHFEKNVSNYKIDFQKAHLENLMSQMAGDYIVIPYDEISLNFKFRKDKIINKIKNETLWQTVCESIYITGNEGKEITEIDTGIFSYFFSLHMENTTTETETHIINTFIPSPNKTTFAQSIPIRLAKIFSEEEVNWLDKLKNQEFPIKHDKLLESLTKNIEREIIRNILFLETKSK